MVVRQQNSPPPPERNGTIIGPAIEIRGTISGEEYLRIQGRIEGNISLSETLIVEPTGIVLATIRARDVVISGIVIGDVYAGDSVSLDAGAKLVGNITAPRVIVADGAAFRGRVDMSSPPSERSRSATHASARGVASSRPSAASANRGGSSRSTSTVATSSASAARGSSSPVSGKGANARGTGGRGAAASNVGDSRSRSSSNQDVTSVSRNGGRGAVMSGDESDATVVVRHESLRKGQEPAKIQELSAITPRKKAQKIARPRVPNRGKRRVERQS